MFFLMLYVQFGGVGKGERQNTIRRGLAEKVRPTIKSIPRR
jgi:hypothetical protein